MKISVRLIIFSIVYLYLPSCNWGEVYYKQINSRYYLSAIDDEQEMHLGMLTRENEGEGLIAATVFAKQLCESNQTKSNSTRYFIDSNPPIS